MVSNLEQKACEMSINQIIVSKLAWQQSTTHKIDKYSLFYGQAIEHTKFRGIGKNVNPLIKL